MHSHTHLSQEYLSNSSMSNENMIQQKYESINYNNYPCECPAISHGTLLGAFDNSVDKYLNFEEEGHAMLENYDHIHSVKQEEIDFPSLLSHKPCGLSFEQGMPCEQNYLPFFAQSSIIPEVNPQTFFHFQSTGQQSEQINSELSTKMKRIMKREKAKSRRKLQTEQQPSSSIQQNQLETEMKTQLQEKNEVTEQDKTFPAMINLQDQIKMEMNQYSEESLLEDNLNQQQQQSNSMVVSGGDSKQQKKVQQMIRNRISAQNSRDRKKAYIQKLEAEKDDILIEGIEQRRNLSQTQSQLQLERTKNASLQQELSELKKKLSNCKCIDDVHNYTANPIHKSYAAFKVAFLAVLGVVLIFNTKPSKDTQAVVNQSSQMMKMLDDLQKQTEEFSKIEGEKQQAKEIRSERQTLEIESLQQQKVFSKDELLRGQLDEESCHNLLQGENHNKEQHSQMSFLTEKYFEAHQGADQIKKDQWIQFVVPKPNQGNTHNRDDLSRDSAETDDMSQHSGQSQKYIQVWAQIKSVNEFEQEN